MKFPFFKIFQSQDQLWRAEFEPRIAKELGSAAAFIIAAQSEKTANKLADILTQDALNRLEGELSCK